MSDPIADYYEFVRIRQADAYDLYQQAQLNGADPVTLAKLWERYIDAGNTGD
jgi:hypothetical protein